ncbi:MAG: DUF4160 domain-containing protein [Bacteroidota bacterium]
MPTVLSIKGFRFFFFSSDRNEPPHVHVKKGKGDAKIWLLPEPKPEYYFDFKSQEEAQIMKIIKENHEFLISKWNEYFEK